MCYKLRERTEEDVKEFITWTYGGIYSFYDNNIQEEKIDGFIQSVNSEKQFSVVDENNNLLVDFVKPYSTGADWGNEYDAGAAMGSFKIYISTSLISNKEVTIVNTTFSRGTCVHKYVLHIYVLFASPIGARILLSQNQPKIPHLRRLLC